MSLRARIIVPPASGSVRKVVLTDDYLVASTVSGWVTCLSLRDLFADVDTDLFEHQKVFHADKPWDVDFRDNILATANDNGKIQLWDMQTGSRRATLVGHTAQATAMLLPDSHTVISGSKDATIIIWDISTQQRRFILTGHLDPITCLKIPHDLLVSADFNGLVCIWDIENGSCCQELEGHGKFVETVAFNDDGDSLVTGASQGDMRLWNVHTG